MWKHNGQAGLRDFCLDERETLRHPQNQTWRIRQTQQRREPKKPPLPDKSFTIRSDLLFTGAETATWLTNGPTPTTRWESGTLTKLAESAKRCVLGGRGVVRTHGHIFREHNQEADHLANLGTEGKTKIAMEGVKNTEEWKICTAFLGW